MHSNQTATDWGGRAGGAGAVAGGRRGGCGRLPRSVPASGAGSGRGRRARRSVARAACGRAPSVAPPSPRAASPPCRTTRALGASRGPRARPASLLLLAAWLAAVAADVACPQELPPAHVVCTSCRSYENAREHSLRVIRESLLAKLGFAQAPNTTGRQLPRVPADLMERFERRPPPAGVQADAPALSRTFVTHTEQDDFLARTDNVLVFAPECRTRMLRPPSILLVAKKSVHQCNRYLGF
ncbi:uncharacterized protein LOC123866740 [Maniola jurtina]|uniref:uncharacterized protein LOC123866740 n=1 Tax=Maniola jurtina TaxID=191418 RepID=UPI001E685D2D|nr:uncharacterized protein LOC123866740 [Maniola jurtina]